MIGTQPLERNRNGVVVNALISEYSPTPEVAELTRKVKQDYETGQRLQTTQFEEFNDMSLIQRMNTDQKAWNSYVEPRSGNPDEDWRANTVRPITRNKIISIAAHVTSTITYPNVFAQNKNDEEDKESALVMRNLMEWVVKNSDYEESFLFGVLGALVNPGVILEARYVEALQTVKQRLADGTLKLVDVVDEILSGFETAVVPLDELYITNIYEYNIQKQKAIMRRRYIDFDEAQAVYGGHENFKYVKPGVKTFYGDGDNMFYEQKDEDLETLVEEVTYYNRREDLQLCFINGILVTDQDQPILHRDTKDRPVYPFAKSGYEPIDEKKFFYYKSAVSKLSSDQDLVNTVWRMILDGTFLSLMPPLNIFGDEEVGSAVVIPGVSNYFAKNSRVEPMNLGSNFSAGYNALSKLEESMSASSQDQSQQGIPGPGGKTAFEIGQLQQNARIQLGLFGKMIGSLVVDFGKLMIHDIINHMTVGQVEELVGDQTKMRFRSFIIPGGKDSASPIATKIELTDEYLGRDFKDGDLLKESYKIMKKEGGINAKTKIMRVNPQAFAEVDFKLFIEADALLPKNDFLEKALNLEAYDRMIQNPMVDQEAVTKDFLVETFAMGESDKYMKKGWLPMPGAAEQPIKIGKTSNLVEQLSGNQSASALLQQ